MSCRALDVREASNAIVRTAHGVGYAIDVAVEQAGSQPPPVARWVAVGARRVALSDGENLIGRDPSAAIFLDTPGVSRRHARIVVSDTEATLEDLGSKNGTMVREHPVTHRVALRDGDPVKIGPVIVVYHAAASGNSTETIVRPARR